MRTSFVLGLTAILLLSACEIPPIPQPEPAFVAPPVAKRVPIPVKRPPIPVVERDGGDGGGDSGGGWGGG